MRQNFEFVLKKSRIITQFVNKIQRTGIPIFENDKLMNCGNATNVKLKAKNGEPNNEFLLVLKDI